MAKKEESKKVKSPHTKRLRKVRESLDKAKIWNLEEAVSFVKKSATAKFDETIELALNLGIDTKQSDQNVRGMVVLPNGTGKNIRVAVFAKGPKAEEAKKRVPMLWVMKISRQKSKKATSISNASSRRPT